MAGFFDSLTSLVNGLANRRNAMTGNRVTSANRLGVAEARAIYKTGLGNKIIRLKAGQALNDTLQFDSTEDKDFWQSRIDSAYKRAGKFALGFGRGIIVIHEPGADLSMPLPEFDRESVKLDVFSGDMVTGMDVSLDLSNTRYLKPRYYVVRGHRIHWTRVTDVTYVEPPELDAPTYQYGGISEFELIRPQIIADGVVERAVPNILEKNSSFFYKVKDFKDALQAGQTDDLLAYFQKMEDVRSIYGAGIIDGDDEVETVDQTLSNLADADMITLRRLSMVTGIPLSMLVGENVKGLNSSGDNERSTFQDMIEALQSDYFQDPASDLARKFGLGPVEFKENQGQTPTERIDVETKIIDNAVKLSSIGEDYKKYLEKYDVTEADDYEKIFGDPDMEETAPTLTDPGLEPPTELPE